MDRRLVIFLLVLLLGCGGSTEWRELILDLRGKDLKTKMAAKEQLRSSGTNALPTIFEMLESEDRAEGEAALDALLISVPHASWGNVLTNLISLLVQTNASGPRERGHWFGPVWDFGDGADAGIVETSRCDRAVAGNGATHLANSGS